MHLDLPGEAKTEATRFRWWQPLHDGHGHDQWAVDEIVIGRYEHLDTLQDDFDVRGGLCLVSDWWLVFGI